MNMEQNVTICDNGFYDFDHNCICNSGFTTYPADSHIECNYEQLSFVTALLLQIFLGAFGAADFYIKRFATGSIKLLLAILTPCMKRGVEACGDDWGFCCVGLPLVVGICSVPVWYLTDVVLYALNHYLDENGVKLAK